MNFLPTDPDAIDPAEPLDAPPSSPPEVPLGQPMPELSGLPVIADYGDVAAYQVAQVQALRNDADATFEWLERARANRDPGVGNTMIDPLVMRYQEDPRLAAFCETVGLPPPTESQTKGL